MKEMDDRLDVSETRWNRKCLASRRLVLQAGLKVVVLALSDGALFKGPEVVEVVVLMPFSPEVATQFCFNPRHLLQWLRDATAALEDSETA